MLMMDWSLMMYICVKTNIQFLSHIIYARGVRPHMKKIEAIMNIQPPQNVKEVIRITVIFQYLGQNLPGLAEITPGYKTQFLEGHALQSLISTPLQARKCPLPTARWMFVTHSFLFTYLNLNRIHSDWKGMSRLSLGKCKFLQIAL